MTPIHAAAAPRQAQSRPYRARAVPVLATLALACALTISLPGPGSADAPPPASLAALGEALCADLPEYCGAAWHAGMERGVPFNEIIAETCMQVYLQASEDAGIACAESALQLAPALPPTLLVAGQFAPGERARHPLWHDKSDQQWRRAVRQYFERVPAYCDQATPIIYHYFPCLLREVRYFQLILKDDAHVN